MSEEPYHRRINVGRTLKVGIGDQIDLLEGYHLEEARLRDNREKVYLMKGTEEIASWYITETTPTGNDILRALEEYEGKSKT